MAHPPAGAVKTHLHTIGHSNLRAEAFLALLTGARVRLLVDTRSKPGSRWAPYTTKGRLKALLEPAGIGYLYLGNSLGGRPADPSLLDASGKPDYAKMALAPAFTEGIEQLRTLIRSTSVCIMCSEEDPQHCHRTHLIGAALLHEGVQLRHIRRDGSVEVQERPEFPDAACPQLKLGFGL